MPASSTTLRLADLRRLAFADVGAPHGPTVLYLHGNPGSRLEVAEPDYRRAFADAGLRVVAVDRPGFGDSDPPARPGHAPFAHDLDALLKHLNLERVTVVGASRGALPALALAALHPRRVDAVGLFGPTGLPDDPRLLDCLPGVARAWLHLVKTRPDAARAALRLSAWLNRRHPAGAAARLGLAVPSAADRAVLREAGPGWIAAFTAGTRRDPGFPVDDWRSWLLDPLGFDPTEVGAPVVIWTGAEDQTCPPAPSAVLARRLPRARRAVLPGVGHLHTPARLVALMQAARAAAGEAAPQAA